MAKKRGMVSWYGGQLIYTGLQAIQQKLLKQSDLRVSRGSPALPTRTTDKGSNCHPTRELWFDYVSDVADGYETTYAVAKAIADPIKLPTEEGLPTGEFLIMGGDEVYPSPKPNEYEDRLVAPYEDAFKEREQLAKSTIVRPALFALPGNHDWYDGLYLFTQLFCAKEEVAGMKTEQTHSYFARSLPSGWWLFALDTGLNEDIDALQLHYFKAIVSDMGASEKLILCTAQPYWSFEILYGEGAKPRLRELLRFIQEEKNIATPLHLTGDLHHYQRHDKKREGKITELALTAGGGGAFLHPTHTQACKYIKKKDSCLRFEEHRPQSPFQPEKKVSFPTEEESREVGSLWNMLSALFQNWGLLIVMGVFYALWALPMPHADQPNLFHALLAALGELRGESGPVLWIIALFIAGLFFTESHCKIFRYAASFSHMSAHLIVSFVANWSACLFVSLLGGWLECSFLSDHDNGWRDLILFFSNVVSGGLLGTPVMVLYLYISMAHFGRHGNETFSWLQCQDYKNFLRLCLSKDGTLKVYVITLRKDPNTDTFTTTIHEELTYKDGTWECKAHERQPSSTSNAFRVVGGLLGVLALFALFILGVIFALGLLTFLGFFELSWANRLSYYTALLIALVWGGLYLLSGGVSVWRRIRPKNKKT